MLAIRWATWWPAPYWIDRFNYLSSIRHMKLEVVFLSAGTNVHQWKLDSPSWKFSYSILNRKQDSSGYFRFHFRLPRPWKLVKGKINALIMPYADPTFLAAALLCLMFRKPYFLFVANTPDDRRRPGRIKEHVKRIVFSRAAGILATGKLQREYALQYVRGSAIYTIGNPSEYYGDLVERVLKSRGDIRREFAWQNRIVLLYVGRLSEEKGLFSLLNALAQNKESGILPKLVLAGIGPLEDALRKLTTQLGLDADFTGFLQRDQLAKYYAASDVFVLPSESEPWGLVVNEAMEFGLPLILSDHIGAAPQLLKEGKTGLSFPVGDVGALATCIEKLYLNEDLRKCMSQTCIQLVKEHSIDRWADAVTEAMYRTIPAWLHKRLAGADPQ